MEVIRTETAAERLMDGAIHVVGLGLASLAVPILLVRAASETDSTVLAVALIYATTLIGMLLASAVYNMRHHAVNDRRRELYRRLDHAMIFLKIAGTYTPIAIVSLIDSGGVRLLTAVWAVALIGAAVKLASPRPLQLVSVTLYLSLGWSFILIAREAVGSLDPMALRLLASGGVLYSGGVVFHLWQSLPFQNAIWHLFVLIATGCMYGAVSIELLSP